MEILAAAVLVVFVLGWCVLMITGHAAKWTWGLWGGSRCRPLFLGVPADSLPALERYYFWLGWIMLVVLSVVLGVAAYDYATNN